MFCTSIFSNSRFFSRLCLGFVHCASSCWLTFLHSIILPWIVCENSSIGPAESALHKALLVVAPSGGIPSHREWESLGAARCSYGRKDVGQSGLTGRWEAVNLIYWRCRGGHPACPKLRECFYPKRSTKSYDNQIQIFDSRRQQVPSSRGSAGT